VDKEITDKSMAGTVFNDATVGGGQGSGITNG